MVTSQYETLLRQVITIVKQAGDDILCIYHRQADLDIQIKADDSPVTAADLAANKRLLAGLTAIESNVPILSEESGIPDYAVRQQWPRYWLIDPLDGTKEFIAKNGEFTVNVALIHKGVPVLGVVYQPVTQTLYAGIVAQGAFCYRDGHEIPIGARSMQVQIDRGQPLVVVTSRRHGLSQLNRFLARSPVPVQSTAIGSSLKLCLVASAEADMYPRFGLTSEWDTAAAQAVVEAAGGHVLDKHWQPLRYNQKHSLLNPEFIVVGSDPDIAKHYFG